MNWADQTLFGWAEWACHCFTLGRSPLQGAGARAANASTTRPPWPEAAAAAERGHRSRAPSPRRWRMPLSAPGLQPDRNPNRSSLFLFPPLLN